MWPVIGGIFSGAGSLIGDWFSSQQSARNVERNIEAQNQQNLASMSFNASQAELNREFQAQEQAVNRSFQQSMSSTAYQRAMTDMKAGGLNPILAAHGGASSPSGGAAAGSAATSSPMNMALHNAPSALGKLGDAIGRAVNSAISMKTFDKMTDQIANIQADTARSKALEKYTTQQTRTEESETRRRSAEAEKAGYQVLKEKLGAHEADAVMRLPKWLFDTLVQGSYSGKRVSDTLDAVPLLSNSAKQIRSLLPARSTREVHTSDTRGHGRSTFEERFRGW